MAGRSINRSRSVVVVTTRITLFASALALGMSAAGTVNAQQPPAPPPGYPGAMYPAPVYPGYAAGLPPYEVVAIVRSTGLEPLTRPFRNGPAYVLRALDPAGQEVRVVVDARIGRIVRVQPLGPRYGAMPPPYGGPYGRVGMVPDGYGPSSRIAAVPPGADVPPSAHAPAAAATPHPSAQAAPPPLPRPRPKMATVEAPAAKPNDAKADVKPDAKPDVSAASEPTPSSPETTASTPLAAPAAAAPEAPDELHE
jgi:hypothetical protein